MSRNEGPPGAVPGPSRLSDKLEVAQDGHVEQVTPAVVYQVVESPGFVEELGGTWAERINNIDKPEYRSWTVDTAAATVARDLVPPTWLVMMKRHGAGECPLQSAACCQQSVAATLLVGSLRSQRGG